MNWRISITALLFIGAPALANGELTMSRTSAPVDDAVNSTSQRNLPGATVDQMITVTNPVGNVTALISTVEITDKIPTTVRFRVSDLNTGDGPVEFVNGTALVVPLLSSGLAYSYKGLNDPTDGLSFSLDNVDYTYQPQDRGGGYDPLVRYVRVKLTGVRFLNLGSFRLRYRVKLP